VIGALRTSSREVQAKWVQAGKVKGSIDRTGSHEEVEVGDEEVTITKGTDKEATTKETGREEAIKGTGREAIKEVTDKETTIREIDKTIDQEEEDTTNFYTHFRLLLNPIRVLS
jgi:hypothetical protein